MKWLKRIDQENDMPGKFLVSLSHNLLDVTTEDIKQFVVIHDLKKMLVFKEDVAIMFIYVFGGHRRPTKPPMRKMSFCSLNLFCSR